MRGASALDAVLKSHPRKPLRVFVVWEPVLFSDTAPPTTRTLARASDPRVAQYWDKHLLLSHAITMSPRDDSGHGLYEGDPDPDAIVWDVVAVFAPGTRWESSFPSPEFHGSPVVRVTDELEQRLQE